MDLDRARGFLAGHARLLDRRRFEVATTGTVGARTALLQALAGYRNEDGGYGSGLEPDLRCPESQPGGALHALEATAEAGRKGPHTKELLDWLHRTTLPDGGLPFALPMADPTACAPFWIDADPTESSLQITAIVAAHAQRVAVTDPAVANHPWPTIATRYCFDRIARLDDVPFAYVLSFVLQLLDSTHDTHPEAPALLRLVARFVPRDGVLRMDDGEAIRPLDYAPLPGRPVRRILDPAAVRADLARLAAGQQPDGGWSVDFPSYSPMAAPEWRGYATVHAVRTLLANWPRPGPGQPRKTSPCGSLQC
jgi:hypothetical protein